MRTVMCTETGCREVAELGPSESDVLERLQEQFRRSQRADLRQVRVAARDGIVRLLGRVSSFHAKQMAQIITREHFRSCRVENAIDVA